MCGIAGLLGFPDSGRMMRKMLSQEAHRGPDGEGVYEGEPHLWLGHRRLAIIDLDTGAQPMKSPDGRFALVHNGEIYNYLELREDLEKRGWKFTTRSDTESLLAGLILEGPAFLQKTVGMFAFAFWDSRERSLMLARDRVGVKPLYYCQPTPGKLAFASELKSLLAVEGVSREVDPVALDRYLALRYVPAPLTMVKGIKKFPAGHMAWHKNGALSFHQYWKADFTSAPEGAIGEEEAADRFGELLKDAVRLRMRSDVPFGAFLSGGVDSSTIVGLMSRFPGITPRTFCVGFDNGPDETSRAEALAKQFGATHTSIRLGPEDLRKLPEVCWSMDEPFGDPIVLAMYMLAARARQDGVKVILTGEGADELQAGYVHHPHLSLLGKLAGVVPGPIMTAAGKMARLAPVGLLDMFFNYPASIGDKGRERLTSLLAAREDADRYLTYVSLFSAEERAALFTTGYGESIATAEPLREHIRKLMEPEDGRGTLDRILGVEHGMWLADNILFKQDKTLMAHSVEGRVPFCDHRLVEFAARLPVGLKLRRGENKVTLRAAGAGIVPQESAGAVKAPFMIPVDGAYGAIMRKMTKECLLDGAFLRRGIFRENVIKGLIDDYPKSPFLVGKQLMAIVMLELWLQKVLDADV
ncbi:MAG: asparagine synthase (glutamine-hydrolyzing) [Nitrospinota bacterium]|nr:asparagine synthase (glutamine-hydrolyzing) [Nitrospinota bacterium]